MKAINEIREELPGWDVTWDGATRTLRARQPGEAGLLVEGGTSDLVVARARALVRLQETVRALFGSAEEAADALSLARWSETRAAVEALSVHTSPQEPRVAPAAPKATATPPEPVRRPQRSTGATGDAIRVAQASGFTGIPCDACGSVNTVRSGTCLRCSDCNHAGGCG